MRQREQKKKIGKYLIAGVLGHGGMGSVYRVVHPETQKTVALKLLNSSSPLTEFLQEEQLLEIFTKEIETMSRLHHPNIAEVLDTGTHNGHPFYTMEYFCNDLGMMIGEKFSVENASRRVPPHQAVNYGLQILAGLEYMHDATILHRDIKPFNMMLNNEGNIKICDFGMARLTTETSFIAENINIGSPYYTAPEQVKDANKADCRADLYSTGVLIYRMVTGALPSMADFMLSRIDKLYDPSWDNFFIKAINWNPDLRFQKAGEMANELLKLKLHWENTSWNFCRNKETEIETNQDIPLRTTPVRSAGTDAQKIFGVDGLWQPQYCFNNMFKFADSKTVLDEATGLVWQRLPSDYPLDRVSADAFIEALNNIGFQGIKSWRLPTVNELLSLVNEEVNPLKKNEDTFLENDSHWYWSCDRRSPETSWYVNTAIGYTGWQENNCLYSVRAVASK